MPLPATRPRTPAGAWRDRRLAGDLATPLHHTGEPRTTRLGPPWKFLPARLGNVRWVLVRLSEARHQTELLLFLRNRGIDELEKIGEDGLSVHGVDWDHLMECSRPGGASGRTRTTSCSTSHHDPGAGNRGERLTQPRGRPHTVGTVSTVP